MKQLKDLTKAQRLAIKAGMTQSTNEYLDKDDKPRGICHTWSVMAKPLNILGIESDRVVFSYYAAKCFLENDKEAFQNCEITVYEGAYRLQKLGGVAMQLTPAQAAMFD